MLESAAWLTAPWDGRIGAGEVQIWLAMLDGLPSDRLAALLSPDEHDRAEKFVFERDRRRFVAARALLRRLLSGCLETDPRDVRFSYDRYGKPSVSGYPAAPQFNVSHSRDVAVFAIGRAGDLGIDIEALRPMPDAEAIAERFFARGERDALRSLAPDQRERAFFSCWTRKEAFVKAVGQGLSHPLDSFEVTLQPQQPVQFVHVGLAGFAAMEWTLEELPGVPGYVGALAVRGRPRTILCRAWSDSAPHPADRIRVR